ncbi:carbohydrate binding family 9 domain-containing protein [Algoriphagus lutimaris]|uniref:carbohydrate binding family 9 domain-containing protein n=1 Tax=Algoriphagus lutimaris TaxID=613197 RepID=UPI00196ABFD0|nr:carbohydrate binding family 9 domain-containing protein [Algoriphagus lutimaris]MBN3519685.1 carbohydrate binding family 9 domain-containing protein [Algoriphagus lutimaris]
MFKKVIYFLGLVLCSISTYAQDIEFKKIDVPVIIDGEIDEIWATADSAYNWMQYFPYDSSLAVNQSVAKVLYDDKNIYVLGIMYNATDDRIYVTPSLRRDFRGAANDNFTVIFDTFQDRTNAFTFGINPFGVRREGLVTNGGSGERSFSLDWDNVWRGEAKMYMGYWVAEIAIPLNSLRFNEGQSNWNVNFYRIDSESAERSTWAPIQRNFTLFNLASLNVAKWEEPTKRSGKNLSVIPYVSGNYNQNLEEGKDAQTGFNAGFDLKYGLTPGLNLDLTVNPDFSQVEVDQQVTNLDRFEIFFPERRQFFLENADLFADYGQRGTRPFFSRRIGVSRDESIGQNIESAIPLGMRLSGKVNDNLRLGVLSMQVSDNEAASLPSYNYSMVSIQQKVFSRSNISAFLVNKQTFESPKEYSDSLYNQWDRTVGVDYNLASADNKINGKIFYHYNIRETNIDSTFAAGMELEYSVPKWSLNMRSQMVGANYAPEVGFVRRTDIQQLAMTYRRRFFPSSGGVQRHGPGLDFDVLGNGTYGLLDWDMNILYDITWRSSAEFSMRLRRQYTYLFNGFDPSGTDGLALPANTEYTTNLIIARYRSDERKKLSYELSTRSGQYFNGMRWNLEGSIQWRYQPLGFTSIDFAYNGIRLPDPYNDANLFLIGPRFDFTFSKKLFWTTFVQYNSQIDNVNINSRLQWRFAPVSDIFLVYTDNYLAENQEGFIQFGGSKSRALVFKMTYWLNL